MRFKFDHAKSAKLSAERGISFDEIIDTIIEDDGTSEFFDAI